MDRETQIMQLIVHAGDARSCAMEALRIAREGQFAQAEEKMQQCEKAMTLAHQIQAELLEDSFGEGATVDMLLVHAQDHLTMAILTYDFAQELIELHRIRYSQVPVH